MKHEYDTQKHEFKNKYFIEQETNRCLLYICYYVFRNAVSRMFFETDRGHKKHLFFIFMIFVKFHKKSVIIIPSVIKDNS